MSCDETELQVEELPLTKADNTMENTILEQQDSRSDPEWEPSRTTNVEPVVQSNYQL